ncbi:MAG: V-type ATP synthase subunit F [Brevinema sp.]
MKVVALVGQQVAPIFYLSGMEVLSPKGSDELKKKFAECIRLQDIALLVISARYAELLKDEIEQVRSSNNELAILEISSSQGDFRAGEKLMKYIREVIGLS